MNGPRGYWRLGEDSGPTTANAAARTPGADAGKQNGLGFGAVGALGGTSDTAAVFDGMASYDCQYVANQRWGIDFE